MLHSYQCSRSNGYVTEVVRMVNWRSTWVVQLVKRLTLDFGSGHDFMVQFMSWRPASGILSLPLSLPLLPSLNKLKKTKQNKKKPTALYFKVPESRS